jgi:transcriptional regulator with XRE-family HTH domain
MATKERRLDRGRRRARQAEIAIGGELREARLTAGLSQREVGAIVGLSHAEISRIERGAAPWVTIEALSLIAAAVGLDLSIRTFPAGGPMRDAAQVALLARFRGLVDPRLTWRTEVPIGIPGDLRAWDAVVGDRTWRVAVDAETRLRDVQALLRREALKRRDDGSVTMVLVVADTRHNRGVLRLARADTGAEFPVRGDEILNALARGQQPSGCGIVLV